MLALITSEACRCALYVL